MMGTVVNLDYMLNRYVTSTDDDKWLVAPYIVDEPYPPFVFGAGMIIPTWSVPCLASAIWRYPTFPTDDLWLGWMAGPCGLSLEHIDRFHLDSWDAEADPQTAIIHLDNKKPHLKQRRMGLHRKYIKVHRDMGMEFDTKSLL